MRDQGFQDWEADALMERAEAGLKYNIFVRSRSRTISNVTLDIQKGPGRGDVDATGSGPGPD
jgi:hypothetical protein